MPDRAFGADRLCRSPWPRRSSACSRSPASLRWARRRSCSASPRLLAVLARLGATFSSNIAHARVEPAAKRSRTRSPASGTGASLLSDLSRTGDIARGEEMLLALFDLDGFKAYNDSFGHTAGDDLLGGSAATGGRGEPMGKRLPPRRRRVLRARLDRTTPTAERSSAPGSRSREQRRRLLASSPPTGTVRAAGRGRDRDRCAAPRRPADVHGKGRRADSALSQTRNVLLGLLREREPELESHLNGVARLAAAARPALDLERRGPRRPRPRGGDARHRQGRDPRRDPPQATVRSPMPSGS